MRGYVSKREKANEKNAKIQRRKSDKQEGREEIKSRI
jgi:hypothetical protein